MGINYQYMLVSTTDAKRFVDVISEKLAEGFSLVGNVSVYTVKGWLWNETFYSHAMLKVEQFKDAKSESEDKDS